jgi:hypothetical protein
MKVFIIVFSLIVFGFLLPAKIRACSCAMTAPCSSFGEASAVFIGVMMSGSEKVEIKTTNKSALYEAGTVRFQIEECFKGNLKGEISVSIDSHINTSCGPYALIRGEKYLVYAYGSLNNLSTGVCTRTSLLTNADITEDLNFLRNLPPVGSGGTLSGNIWSAVKEETEPMAGIQVLIKDSKGQVVGNVMTDKEGEFKLEKLPAGKYKVEPIFPRHYADYQQNKMVTVPDRGCVEVGFETKIDGRISGRVFDSKGRPASVPIRLEPVEPTGNLDTESGFSHLDGQFEIKGISPGEYYLFFELNPWSKNRGKYFYPGTKNKEQAAVIKLETGQQLKDIQFAVPPEFIVQTIEGQVVWADGTPAKNVTVWLLCPTNLDPKGSILEFSPPILLTDKQGRFKFLGFKGITYWLEARSDNPSAPSERDGQKHSAPMKLTLEKDLANLKVVLDQEGFSTGCSKEAEQEKNKLIKKPL